MAENTMPFGEEVDRRDALKKAALGAAAGGAAWTAPSITGLVTRPTFASAGTTTTEPPCGPDAGTYTFRMACSSCEASFGGDFLPFGINGPDAECKLGECVSNDVCVADPVVQTSTIPSACGSPGDVVANWKGPCGGVFDTIDADLTLPANCVLTSAGTPGAASAGTTGNHIDTTVGASTIDYVIVCT